MQSVAQVTRPLLYTARTSVFASVKLYEHTKWDHILPPRPLGPAPSVGEHSGIWKKFPVICCHQSLQNLFAVMGCNVGA